MVLSVTEVVSDESDFDCVSWKRRHMHRVLHKLLGFSRHSVFVFVLYYIQR